MPLKEALEGDVSTRCLAKGAVVASVAGVRWLPGEVADPRAGTAGPGLPRALQEEIDTPPQAPRRAPRGRVPARRDRSSGAAARRQHAHGRSGSTPPVGLSTSTRPAAS
ncbi:hypothetical protein GCM10009756_02200 [Pseudokineococcus marinus]